MILLQYQLFIDISPRSTRLPQPDGNHSLFLTDGFGRSPVVMDSHILTTNA